jgi:hypothetical protein
MHLFSMANKRCKFVNSHDSAAISPLCGGHANAVVNGPCFTCILSCIILIGVSHSATGKARMCFDWYV